MNALKIIALLATIAIVQAADEPSYGTATVKAVTSSTDYASYGTSTPVIEETDDEDFPFCDEIIPGYGSATDNKSDNPATTDDKTSTTPSDKISSAGNGSTAKANEKASMTSSAAGILHSGGLTVIAAFASLFIF